MDSKVTYALNFFRIGDMGLDEGLAYDIAFFMDDLPTSNAIAFGRSANTSAAPSDEKVTWAVLLVCFQTFYH
jgi:hypothetical protein